MMFMEMRNGGNWQGRYVFNVDWVMSLGSGVEVRSEGSIVLPRLES